MSLLPYTSPSRQTNNTPQTTQQPSQKGIDPYEIASAGGGILNFIGGLITNKKNRQFAKEQADTAWKRELEQWHRANQYNSPAEKMARLKEAGLNPNLAYGNPTTAGVGASSSPNAQMAKYQAQMPQISMARQLAEIDNIRADTKATLTGEKYTGARTEGQESINAINKVKADWASDGYLKQEMLAKLGLTNTAKDLNIMRGKLMEAQKVLTENKTNLMKSGLNNSDNVILRMIATWGVKNPVDASQLLIWLGSLGNSL